jgi:hypothetical protein
MQFGMENWQDDEETIHRILEFITQNSLLPNCLKRILNISKQPLLHLELESGSEPFSASSFL